MLLYSSKMRVRLNDGLPSDKFKAEPRPNPATVGPTADTLDTTSPARTPVGKPLDTTRVSATAVVGTAAECGTMDVTTVGADDTLTTRVTVVGALGSVTEEISRLIMPTRPVPPTSASSFAGSMRRPIFAGTGTPDTLGTAAALDTVSSTHGTDDSDMGGTSWRAPRGAASSSTRLPSIAVGAACLDSLTGTASSRATPAPCECTAGSVVMGPEARTMLGVPEAGGVATRVRVTGMGTDETPRAMWGSLAVMLVMRPELERMVAAGVGVALGMLMVVMEPTESVTVWMGAARPAWQQCLKSIRRLECKTRGRTTGSNSKNDKVQEVHHLGNLKFGRGSKKGVGLGAESGR
ncbi:hypothetical protein C2E23DRAFT_246628 [Lenzites betulinus]|nr:hypothetical protein C2E23DRAFT_246628 [Lenzites betulinus]